ncbi:hydrolase 1, exosortase A system-associated [Erythrobacter sp. SCSIO 43205]|uniref:hydrolase 1, exosortase A system-associated n=1 Tax=Erythrobacter sp. SCSIO 43205 TaxID=2779361 RepID=UPI001CA95E21|nr:hydrolase 1, exosortase A system-associated [Erythrobacter sp. SCSIO 43205]UAB77279.1 hydrolase 1, exosortase A system-associated [Erythrobacter sp. SCSIO 43205]
MSRLHFDFGSEGIKLAGSLDTAPGVTGLLIVNGGNEIRSGAFAGQSRLAARIAQKGFPVFRFDRAGTGDSEGDNQGYRNSASDITAALEAFRAMAPQVERVLGFGNCDAASALMLMGGAGFDGLILSNPWTFEDDESEGDEPTHSAEAIRSRYLAKLKNPSEIMRLLKGGVNLRKLVKGLGGAIRPSSNPSSLTDEMRHSLTRFGGRVHFLLAGADRTAQAFDAAWDKNDPRIRHCEGAGHAYVEPEHREWLEAQILSALRA